MNFDLEEVKKFIAASSDETKIYIGSDSERYKIKRGPNKGWYARYSTVVIVHRNGKNGAKIFGRIDNEKDYDKKLSRPAMRMMNEVYRASALYLELEDSIGYKDFEIHLDINPSVMHGSNVAMGQAMGYIKGMHGLTPKIKPEAFAASCAADRMGNY